MPFCEKKIIVSGNVVEIYTFETGFFYNEPDFYIEKSVGDRKNVVDMSSIYRTKRNLRRLIDCNSGGYVNNKKVLVPRFITFTFKENVTDLTIANNHWNRFIDRFNRKFYSRGFLKYVSIPEFQKRGAVHYHALFFNMPYLSEAHSKIFKSWGQGFVFREDVKKGSVTRYLSKYIEKGFSDKRLKNRRRYLASRGLIRSVQIRRKEDVEKFVLDLKGELEYSNIFSASFPHGSRVFYQKFSVPRNRMPAIPQEPPIEARRQLGDGWFSTTNPYKVADEKRGAKVVLRGDDFVQGSMGLPQ